MDRLVSVACVAILAGSGCGEGQLRRVAGILQVTPRAVSLGPIPAALVVEAPLTLRNIGDDALTWQVRRTGDTGSLSITPTEGTLSGGEQTSVRVTVVAPRPGPMSAALIFDTDSRQTAEVLVPVTASVTEDILAVRPSQVAFGPVRTGFEGVRTIEVENLGPDPVEIDAIVEDPERGFSVVDPTPVTLRPHRPTPIRVRFAPPFDGPASTRLQLRGMCRLGCSRSVPMTATGVPSGVVCDADTVDFGFVNVDTCAERNLTCTNVTDAAVAIATVTLDPQASPFSADARDLPPSVRPGEQVRFDLSYCPDDRIASEALLTLDTLEVDAGLRRATVTVKGFGGGPDIAATPTLRYFGAAAVGDARQRTVLVENRGDKPLSLSGAQILPSGAPFSIPPLPATVVPAAGSVTLAVDFRPTDVREYNAALVITSDDPDSPRLEVRLEGEGLPAGVCEASLTPSATSFGLVEVRAVSEATLQLRADETTGCAWFDPRLEGDPSFRFTRTPPRRGQLPPGGSAAFGVQYAPAEDSPALGHQARFLVDVPHATPTTLQSNLAGVAASSDLLVFPRQVDFGLSPLGQTRRRTVFVYNTGDQTHQLWSAGLTSPSSNLRAQPPPLPVNLRPGDMTQVEIQFTPSSEGVTRTQLSMRSDRLPAALRVEVRGEGRNSNCGHLQGEICAPTGRWPADGAAIRVVAADGLTYETVTDENGRFFSYCLPPGPARVQARRGHFTVERDVTIQLDRTTSIPSATCLAPPPAGQVAVVTGQFDRIETLLAAAGMGYVVDTGISSPPRLLTDRDLLLSYDLVFLNCGFSDVGVQAPEVADNLRAFVDAGGSLYVSDLAYDALEAAWPDALEMFGDDRALGAAEVGRELRVTGRALSPSLLRVLGRARIELLLDGDYALVEGAGPNATVHLAGSTFGPAGGLRPLVVTHRPGPTSGIVAYTTVHQSGQVQDEQIRRLLEHLVFSL